MEIDHFRTIMDTNFGLEFNYYGGGNEYAHADQHNIQFQPGNPNNALFTTDGGVFLTKTANLFYPVFIERNQGYNTLQFYTCAISPTPGSEEYLGGLQDNSTVLYDDAFDINDIVTGGDGAYCFWDNNESNIYITSSQWNNYSVFFTTTTQQIIFQVAEHLLVLLITIIN